MISSRLTAKAQTTIPRPIRQALGVGPGDTIEYEIANGRVVLTRALDDEDRIGIGDFTTFTEWFDELDAEFDKR